MSKTFDVNIFIFGSKTMSAAANPSLKVHKIENFFGFDFEICTFS